MIYRTYVIVVSLAIISARLIDTSDENCVKFVLDVLRYYKSSCITILYDGNNDMKKLTSLENLSREFSKARLSSTTIKFSQLKKHKSLIDTCYLRPTFVVLLNSRASVDEFAKLTTIVNVMRPVWIVPSTSLVESYIENYEKHESSLHLTYNVDVILANFSQGVVYELYALENRTRMAKLATWTTGEGLVMKETAYQRRGNLRGRTLRVTTVTGMPLVSFVDGKAAGLYGDLLIELSKVMNFKVEYILATNNSYGTWNERDGNWSGMMGLLAANKVDLAVADFRITKQRLRSVEFTIPLLSSYDRLYIKQPSEGAVWSGHVQTFSRGIWASIGLLILGTPILLTVITLVRGRRLFVDVVVEYYFHTLGIYCQQGLTEFPADFSSRLVYLFTFISSIVIYAAYSATLVSSLTIRAEVLPFTTLKEFTRDGSYELIVVDNSATYDVFAGSTDPVFKKMFSLMKPNLPRMVEEGFDLICKEKVALYVHEIFFPKMNLQCKVASIETGRRSSLSMALPKDSPYRQFINFHLQRFRDSGLLNRLKRKYMKKTHSTESDHAAAGLRSILSVLILMMSGIILATVILFLEKLHFKYKQRSSRMPASLLRTTKKASQLKIRQQRKIFAVHNLSEICQRTF